MAAEPTGTAPTQEGEEVTTAAMLVRLLEVLHRGRVLDLSDVSYIVGEPVALDERGQFYVMHSVKGGDSQDQPSE